MTSGLSVQDAELTVVAPHRRSSLHFKTNNIHTTMFAKLFFAAVAFQALLVSADPEPSVPGEYMRPAPLGNRERTLTPVVFGFDT